MDDKPVVSASSDEQSLGAQTDGDWTPADSWTFCIADLPKSKSLEFQWGSCGFDKKEDDANLSQPRPYNLSFKEFRKQNPRTKEDIMVIDCSSFEERGSGSITAVWPGDEKEEKHGDQKPISKGRLRSKSLDWSEPRDHSPFTFNPAAVSITTQGPMIYDTAKALTPESKLMFVFDKHKPSDDSPSSVSYSAFTVMTSLASQSEGGESGERGLDTEQVENSTNVLYEQLPFKKRNLSLYSSTQRPFASIDHAKLSEETAVQLDDQEKHFGIVDKPTAVSQEVPGQAGRFSYVGQPRLHLEGESSAAASKTVVVVEEQSDSFSKKKRGLLFRKFKRARSLSPFTSKRGYSSLVSEEPAQTEKKDHVSSPAETHRSASTRTSLLHKALNAIPARRKQAPSHPQLKDSSKKNIRRESVLDESSKIVKKRAGSAAFRTASAQRTKHNPVCSEPSQEPSGVLPFTHSSKGTQTILLTADKKSQAELKPFVQSGPKYMGWDSSKPVETVQAKPCFAVNDEAMDRFWSDSSSENEGDNAVSFIFKNLPKSLNLECNIRDYNPQRNLQSLGCAPSVQTIYHATTDMYGRLNLTDEEPYTIIDCSNLPTSKFKVLLPHEAGFPSSGFGADSSDAASSSRKPQSDTFHVSTSVQQEESLEGLDRELSSRWASLNVGRKEYEDQRSQTKISQKRESSESPRKRQKTDRKRGESLV